MVRYSQTEVRQEGAKLRVTARAANTGREPWRGASIGWQVYDPDTSLFIQEGEWMATAGDVAPGAETSIDIAVEFPMDRGCYRVYISPLLPGVGWLYAQGAPMLVLDAEVAEDGAARLLESRATTLRALRWRNLGPALRRAVTQPFADLMANRRLIASLVRRDILSRYRGSFGDVAWTLLHPLLLMLTYFFVFGVVLQTRFGADGSRTGFALYFLAGMLPWLAFSEPAARAAHTILEHRGFVKKLVFPVSILPVNNAVAGLVTSLLATLLFLAALIVVRGALPWTALLLPLWIAPLFLFTLGFCWMLSGAGVFLRDLAHMMTFVLTLWFFITPICYPESSLPPAVAPLLLKNPMVQFVRAYRLLLLEGQAPAWIVFAKVWAVSLAVFFLGHFWFTRLKRTFADAL